ncbi:MAG: tRNA (uridine(34)/cytosine(34)/5-carboxymethylaminomethyluridine(34)-2'-O)-methyltransferase TrmL [Pseudomonadota bacterium]
MFHCILYEPEIPQNTGSIIRLSANTGFKLHLIEPLGFELDNTRLKRAGLDYHEWADMQIHSSLDACIETIQPPRIFACSTRGSRNYTDNAYQAGDAFLFGPETRGLPQALLDTYSAESVIRIPMRPESRSLNLSNAASVILYEAWRQNGFEMP